MFTVALFMCPHTYVQELLHSSGPQPFWHQGLVSWKTVFARSGAGMVRAAMRAMGSDGGRQMKLCSLARRSPPAVPPGSYQAAARRVGTPALQCVPRNRITELWVCTALILFSIVKLLSKLIVPVHIPADRTRGFILLCQLLVLNF